MAVLRHPQLCLDIVFHFKRLIVFGQPFIEPGGYVGFPNVGIDNEVNILVKYGPERIRIRPAGRQRNVIHIVAWLKITGNEIVGLSIGPLWLERTVS